MAENTLYTRILLKYDSLANWTSKNTILKKTSIKPKAIIVLSILLNIKAIILSI